MKTIARTVGSVLLGLCMARVAAADEQSVTVTGKAEVKQKPDVAFVTLYVKGDALTMVEAAKEADQKVEEVKNALKKYKEIQTIEVSDAAVGEQQREYWRPDQKEEGQHPEIARRLRIAMSPDPARVYELIDTAISAGALMQLPSSVHYSGEGHSIVVYGLLKSAATISQAHQAAIAEARQQAESLARLAGKKLGDTIRVACEGASPAKWTIPIYGPSDDPAPHFSHNSNEIVVSCALSVTFELKK